MNNLKTLIFLSFRFAAGWFFFLLITSKTLKYQNYSDFNSLHKF